MSESPWTPNLTTKTMVNELIETLIYQAPTLFGVNEIIPDCEITSVDPAAVGVAVIPRYITVRIHQYTEDVLWRGRPSDISVGDRVTVMLMAEGNRHEVLASGGATGFDPGVLAPTARGDILAADATPAWDLLALGLAHQILKVNAGATDPVWASFDWDEISIAAAADMVHDHESAAEGGRVAMIGPDGTIRIEIDANGDAVIRLGDAAGLRSLKILNSTPVEAMEVWSDGTADILGYLDVHGELYVDLGATVVGDLHYRVYTITVPVAWSPFGVGDNGVHLANAVGGNIIFTLDPAASRLGQSYTFKKIDASANTVTINPDGVETIDGALTYVIAIQYDSITIISHAGSWWII